MADNRVLVDSFRHGHLSHELRLGRDAILQEIGRLRLHKASVRCLLEHHARHVFGVLLFLRLAQVLQTLAILSAHKHPNGNVESVRSRPSRLRAHIRHNLVRVRANVLFGSLRQAKRVSIGPRDHDHVLLDQLGCVRASHSAHSPLHSLLRLLLCDYNFHILEYIRRYHRGRLPHG